MLSLRCSNRLPGTSTLFSSCSSHHHLFILIVYFLFLEIFHVLSLRIFIFVIVIFFIFVLGLHLETPFLHLKGEKGKILQLRRPLNDIFGIAQSRMPLRCVHRNSLGGS